MDKPAGTVMNYDELRGATFGVDVTSYFLFTSSAMSNDVPPEERLNFTATPDGRVV